MKFLGWMLERTVDGNRLMINPQLIEAVVQDSGLASSTRKCATAGVKDWVADETPREKEEHSYFRLQVGRLLFFSVLRPDLQYAVGQLARHASAPTVSDRIALKRLIRFLSTTCDTKLELFLKRRLVLFTCQMQTGLAFRNVDPRQGCGAACRVGRQFVGSAVGRSSGDGSFEAVEVRLLAIQSWVSMGRLRLQKVLSAENVADMLTKHVSRNTWKSLCEMLALRASV